MRNRTKQTAIITTMAVAVILVTTTEAHAGAGGTEFADILDLFVGWAKGTFGKLISIIALIVGVAQGTIRGSVMAAVPAVGIAAVLFYGPDVIDGILTAGM